MSRLDEAAALLAVNAVEVPGAGEIG